jgi:hypothetical protein
VTRAAAPARSTLQRARAKPLTPADTAGERRTTNASVMQIDVPPASTQLRSARSAVRNHLDREHYGADEIRAVEAVVSELLGAALDGGVHETLGLSVESFALLTSVRVHCSVNIQLRDEPFGIRERVLGGYAFAWGKRRRDDGSVDLWAELARSGH